MSRKSETLYTSPLVTVRDVVCTEGCGNGRHEEQCQAASLAFVRSGTFVRRDRMGRHVADATRVVFFDPAEPYMVDHPVPGGDRSTVLLFDQATLREAVRYARGEPERIFVRATLAGSAGMHLEHRRLLAAAHRRDAVEVEETALHLLQIATSGDEDGTPLRGAAARRAAGLAADAQVLIAGSFAGRVTLEGLARTLGRVAVWPVPGVQAGDRRHPAPASHHPAAGDRARAPAALPRAPHRPGARPGLQQP